MHGLKSAFWNARQRRLRAGWRLLIQLALFLAVLVGLALLNRRLGEGAVAAVVCAPLYLAAGLGLAWLVARFLDRRPIADYGFHLNAIWWLDFGFGLLLGASLMTGVFVAEYLTGWVAVTDVAADGSSLATVVALLLSLLVYLAVGVNEEFTFRGYQLRNLAEGLAGRYVSPRRAVVLALLLSSACFGLAHLTNPDATAAATLNIIFAGFILGLAYVLTGELALPIGIHLTWNYFQGAVFGFPVSGNKPSRHLLTLRQDGPELWTGGAFGPEGGLLAVAAIVVGCGLVVLWVAVTRKQLRLHEMVFVPLIRQDEPRKEAASSRHDAGVPLP
jgi:membrane protease YdiL (CAAX protease family)